MRITFGKMARLASLTSSTRPDVLPWDVQFDPRELEWQRRYEANDTPWDKGAPSPALLNFLRTGHLAGRVLVPGCGRGHDARALAAQSDATVVGLDLSPMATAQAQKLTPADAGNIRFVTGDFLSLPADMDGSFDWVVEHTCFCAIEPRQRADYVAAAARALSHGGRLFAIFYLNPRSETAPPFPVSREQLSALFDPHFALLEEWIPKCSFPGREQRELVRILQKR
jgi:SAM-dependent methyltransferase